MIFNEEAYVSKWFTEGSPIEIKQNANEEWAEFLIK